MSSLTAWNNFLKEGFEILGDDFEELTSHNQVKDTFARLTKDVIPLLTVEPDLYAFVDGETLKSWREKYEREVNIPHRVGFGEDFINIIESDAMIMKDDRAKHARLLHGYILDAIQEGSAQFEDASFEEQDEPSVREVLEETKVRIGNVSTTDVLNAVALSIHLRYPLLKSRVMKDCQDDQIVEVMKNMQSDDIWFTVEHASPDVFDSYQVEILNYILQYEDAEGIISLMADELNLQEETVRSILKPSAFDKNIGLKHKVLNWIRKQENEEEEETMTKDQEKKHDSLQLEIIEIKERLLETYPSVSEIYNTLVKRFKHSLSVLSKCVSPSKAGRSMATKRRIIQDMKTMLKENKQKEAQPMKTQEKTVQESINTFAANLAKAVIKQLDVNDLNAEIADAFTVVTNLKTGLANAEAQLNTYKSVKDMLSKKDLSEDDILILTNYVDSMGK